MTTLRVARSLMSAFLILSLAAGCNSMSAKDSLDGEMTADGEPSLDENAESGDFFEDQVDTDLADAELNVDQGTSAPVEFASKASTDDVAIEDDPVEVAPANDNMARSTGASQEVTGLKYLSMENGGTIVVQTSGVAKYQVRESSNNNQLIIELPNVTLPTQFRRPYMTNEFRQGVVSFQAYQNRETNSTRVVVQLDKSQKKMNVIQSGETIKISSGAMVNEASEQSVADRIQDSAGPTWGEEQEGKSSAMGLTDKGQDSRILPTSSLDIKDNEEVRYYGKPISVEVYDTPVREVISLIAEHSGANLIVSDDVTGTVSLKLRQIPWDQALLLVMKSRSLGYVRQGSVLRIAPLGTLQRETETAIKVLEAQKASEPLKVKVIPVSYSSVASLQNQVQTFLTKRGRAVADTRTSSLIVTDVPETLERVASLVEALDTPPLQVLIEGKVVEAVEKFRRDFGVSWMSSGTDIPVGNATMRQNLSINPIPKDGSGILDMGIRIGTLHFWGDLDASLSLLESEDMVKIISSPRIVAMNNVAASIVQSVNIAIPVQTQSQAGTTTGVEYKPVELKLEVTPQISTGGDIIMDLNIRREFAGQRIAGQQPDINSRQAKTTVMVRNGQTAVVGGVYQSDADNYEQGVPFLRSIPLLGWLFKYKTRSEDKNELLVFLTPRILNAEKGYDRAKKEMSELKSDEELSLEESL